MSKWVTSLPISVCTLHIYVRDQPVRMPQFVRTCHITATSCRRHYKTKKISIPATAAIYGSYTNTGLYRSWNDRRFQVQDTVGI